MKGVIPFLVTLLIAACGDQPDSATALAREPAATEVTFCSCVNEPITTDAKAKACNEIMNSVPAADVVAKSMACRNALRVPDGGPDLCYCLRATNPEPSVAEACQEIIPEDMTPLQMSAKIGECSQR